MAAAGRLLGLVTAADLAFAALVAGHVHYWRTRMSLDVASRVVAYLWILSIILYMHLVLGGRPIWE